MMFTWAYLYLNIVFDAFEAWEDCSTLEGKCKWCPMASDVTLQTRVGQAIWASADQSLQLHGGFASWEVSRSASSAPQLKAQREKNHASYLSLQQWMKGKGGSKYRTFPIETKVNIYPMESIPFPALELQWWHFQLIFEVNISMCGIPHLVIIIWNTSRANSHLWVYEICRLWSSGTWTAIGYACLIID